MAGEYVRKYGWRGKRPTENYVDGFVGYGDITGARCAFLCIEHNATPTTTSDSSATVMTPLSGV